MCNTKTFELPNLLYPITSSCCASACTAVPWAHKNAASPRKLLESSSQQQGSLAAAHTDLVWFNSAVSHVPPGAQPWAQKFKIAKLYEFVSWFVWMEKLIIVRDECWFLRLLAWIMSKINRLKNIWRDWNDWNLNGFKVQKDKTVLLKLTIFR